MTKFPPADEIRRICQKLGITAMQSTPAEKKNAVLSKKAKLQPPTPKSAQCACGKPSVHPFGGGECDSCRKARWARSAENRTVIHHTHA